MGFPLLRRTLLGLAAAAVLGCNPTTTPAYPVPDIEALPGDFFPLRAGDLALVYGSGEFLYLSVRTIGVDTRCPPDAECAEPGFVLVDLELEDTTRQGAAQLRIPPSGEAVATFGAFEIHSLQVEPPGSAERILPADYLFVLQVFQR